MANEEYNTNTEINDYLTVATDAVTGVTGLGDGCYWRWWRYYYRTLCRR